MNLNPLSEGRSPHWPAVRRAHLLIEPVCQACGGSVDLQVHHILPYHVRPDLELDQSNLITLCEHPSRNCHYRLGHGFAWAGWCDEVREDAAISLARIAESRKRAAKHGAHMQIAYHHPYFRRRRISRRDASGTFWPTEVAKAYGAAPVTRRTASTPIIGIVSLGGGVTAGDTQTAFINMGLPRPTLGALSVRGAQNHPGDDADTENALDVQASAGLYSAITGEPAHVLVAFAPNDDTGIADAIRALVDAGASVVSISWGSPEDRWSGSAMSATETALQYANSHGVPVFAAAGDNDSGDGESGQHVDYPSSSAYTVGCGGTNLVVHSDGSISERVWNDGRGDGTGGGISAEFPQPAWQAPVFRAQARCVPDVAGVADPQTGWKIVVGGQVNVIGGTSAVSPMWAGIIAAAIAGGAKGADLLKTLYANPGVLNDVVNGNNGAFQAGPGYDCCTGLGTPKIAQVLALLTGGAPSQPTPTPQPQPGQPTPGQPAPFPPGRDRRRWLQWLLWQLLYPGQPFPGSFGVNEMQSHANGVIIGAILQALPELLPIFLKILGAAQQPTQTQKQAMRATVMDHLKAQFDLQTLIDNLPAIEAAVEQILKLAQTFTVQTPRAFRNLTPVFFEGEQTKHSFGTFFGPRTDASTIQTDLQNLQAAQATLNTDTAALATAQATLNTAQQTLATAQTAVAADKANIKNLVDQAIQDIQKVYALPS